MNRLLKIANPFFYMYFIILFALTNWGLLNIYSERLLSRASLMSVWHTYSMLSLS